MQKKFVSFILSIILLLFWTISIPTSLMAVDEQNLSPDENELTIVILKSEDGSDMRSNAEQILSQSEAVSFVAVEGTAGDIVWIYYFTDGEIKTFIEKRTMDDILKGQSIDPSDSGQTLPIEIGQRIEADEFNITLERAGIEPVLLPSENAEDALNVLAAKDGHVIFYTVFNVENLSKSRNDYYSTLKCEFIYGDGYTFNTSRYQIQDNSIGRASISNTSLKPLDSIRLAYVYIAEDYMSDDEEQAIMSITIGKTLFEHNFKE